MADDLKINPGANAHEPLGRAEFSSFAESTKEDWQKISAATGVFQKGHATRILTHLKMLEGDCGGFPVSRLEHSLQTATMAHRAGKDEEYVVCALLHDIGDTLGSYNHADIAAAILKPFVSEANHWMVAHHGIFQGYYFFHHLGLNRNMREAFRDSPYFAQTEEFCAKYDSPSFDRAAETLPLSHFEPMVRRVLGQPSNSMYVAAMETGE